MAKFNAKNLAIAVFLGVLLVGVIGVVSAQQALPTGGDSFETAVEIKPGSYEGVGLIEKGVKEYFYINVKPGQELKLEGTFQAFSDAWGEEELTLYNEDRKQLAKEGESLDKGEQTLFSFSWLSGSAKDLHKYYIKRECTWHKIELLSLDISLTDRYDAGSQTDAGDVFEKAMKITSREYQGYLSGKAGADTKDFYKVAVEKGETLIVKVTPPSEATMRVVVYDKDRRVLKDEYASNPGAIITNFVPIAKSGDVFVGVICERYCSEKLVAYTMNITIQPAVETGVSVEKETPTGEVPDVITPRGEVPEALTARGAEDMAKAVGKGIAAVIIFWIVGPLVLLIIVGVVIYLFLKKKR